MPSRRPLSCAATLFLMLSMASAQAQLPQLCTGRAGDVLLRLAKEHPLDTFSNLGDVKSALDAYLEAPDGKGLDALGRSLGETTITLVLGNGATVLLAAGKFSYRGTEWTIDQARALQVEAFICGGVSAGQRLPVGDFFETGGAQAIAPGVTCNNFGDWVDTVEKYERLRSLFKGDYTNSLMQFGTTGNKEAWQDILDAQWTVIENTWAHRMAARQLEKLQNDLRRLAAEQAAKPCTTDGATPPTPPGELGSDTTDPATLPEPPAPPGGQLVLTRTDVIPHSLSPGVEVSAAPQRISVKAYWGEATCVWSSPPKSLTTEQVFGFDFTVTATAAKGSSLAEGIVVQSSFANVNVLPTELSVYAVDGASQTAAGHLELGTGDLIYAETFMTWGLTVGGCGGHVDYTYKFVKP